MTQKPEPDPDPEEQSWHPGTSRTTAPPTRPPSTTPESIAWTDHLQSRTFTTPQQFTDEFLVGWIQASSDIQIVGSRYLDGGDTVVCTFTGVGTQDGPLGPVPATGEAFALPLCEMWHFDSRRRVVGGDIYYDQVSLLTQLGLMPQPSSP